MHLGVMIPFKSDAAEVCKVIKKKKTYTETIKPVCLCYEKCSVTAQDMVLTRLNAKAGTQQSHNLNPY